MGLKPRRVAKRNIQGGPKSGAKVGKRRSTRGVSRTPAEKWLDKSVASEWVAFALSAEQVIVEEYAGAYGLKEGELDILRALVHGTPRVQLSSYLDISENTLKSRVRVLLNKAGQESLPPLIWEVHQRARRR